MLLAELTLFINFFAVTLSLISEQKKEKTNKDMGSDYPLGKSTCQGRKEERKEGRKEVFEVVEIVEVCRDYAGLSITRRY